MPPRYRPIAPNQGSASTRNAESSVRPKKVGKNRSHVKIACQACRARKSACDGGRPSCVACHRRSIDCVYITEDPDETHSAVLKRKLEQLESDLQQHARVVKLFSSASEAEAAAMSSQLKSASDLSTFLSAVEGRASSRMRPSDLKATHGILPPTTTKFEQELTMRFHVVYPKLIPIDLDSIAHSPLLAAEAEPALLYPSSSTPGMSRALHSEMTVHTGPRVSIDPRLDGLDIGYWTTVPISNHLAAAAISFYISNDFPQYGFFDADLFVEDLVACRSRFCSAFMVAALLYYACQGLAAIDLEASTYCQLFLRSASMLWHADRHTDSLTTIAAMSIFGLGCACQNDEGASLELFQETREMGRRMQLFDVWEEPAEFRTATPELQSAMTHTAWGLYNYLV